AVCFTLIVDSRLAGIPKLLVRSITQSPLKSGFVAATDKQPRLRTNMQHSVILRVIAFTPIREISRRLTQIFAGCRKRKCKRNFESDLPSAFLREDLRLNVFRLSLMRGVALS